MRGITFSGFSDEISPDTEVQFRGLNELGIGYFDPRNVNGANVSDLDDAGIDALTELMNRYGIKCACIGSPIGKSPVTDPAGAEMSRLENTIKVAERLRAKYIRVFSFYPPDNGDFTGYEDEVIKRLSDMTALAESADIVLLHENEKGIYGDVADKCLELLRGVDSPYFRAVFDAANFVQCGQEIRPAYETLKDYIAYMHIKDALENGEVVPAGYGKGEYPWLIRQLSGDGYSGFMCLEPHLAHFSGFEALERERDRVTPSFGQASSMSGLDRFRLAYRAIREITDSCD